MDGDVSLKAQRPKGNRRWHKNQSMSHEQNQARNHLELNLQPESLSQYIKEISSDGAPVVAGEFSISQSKSGRPVSL